MNEKPLFQLIFKIWTQYSNALEYVSKKHPKQFDFDSQQMTISFFSDANRTEMKSYYDILGWQNSIINP